ncbi:hypothetical protein AB832_06610 [Flavobacteriaceae bacterium (ex Bugula neritina AB1)]|nr:hypothetical protein AB832_06610 [Flavobacteriaceae bacterium (ex Bugula neritina AB1)]
MNKKQAFKFKLKTNKHQNDIFYKWSRQCHFLWNTMLAKNLYILNNNRKVWKLRGNKWLRVWENNPMNYYEMNWYKNHILKKTEQCQFLHEPPAQSLQICLKKMHLSFSTFFKKCFEGSGKPKFKNRRSKLSFSFPYTNKQAKLNNDSISIPKVGRICFKRHREIIGNIKNITISKECNHWYISIQTEIEQEQPVIQEEKSIGIDLGIKKTIQCSDGKEYSGDKTKYQKIENKRIFLQQIQSLKRKFSNNWYKVLDKIKKLYKKSSDIKKDFLHQVSTEIVRKYNRIHIEDLKIKNMSKSAKGTIDNPGKQVAQKSGLNKSILEQGWGMFREFLQYKLDWIGGRLIKVNPKNTSIKCSKCGYTDKENRPTQELFKCLSCKYECNADLNAAINIHAVGLLVC